MERAIITINESGNVNIPDSNVWMLFSELEVLFDVAAPTLKAAKVIPYTYWATLYNMDMIVTLAFRINSYGAERIRNEVLKRIYGRKEKVCELVKT